MIALNGKKLGKTPASLPKGSYHPPYRTVPVWALDAIDSPETPLHPAFGSLECDIGAEVAGEIPAERLAAAAYKIRDENFLARGPGEEEFARRLCELGDAIRTVRVR